MVAKLSPFLAALFALTSCAVDRYQHTFGNADFSPSARRLSRPDLEDIADIVSRPFIKHVIWIGQDQSRGPRDEINVIVEYRVDETYIYHLKKSQGGWRILDEGRISVSLSRIPVAY
ncbi:MAG: hypothetical protein QOH39_3008 [Verrucomicrobiota bacterium]|jgi:hypothetical protein